jgi:hypothetical protein
MPSGELNALRASGPIRVGDELIVAVPYGEGFRQGVAVYTRTAGMWRLDTVAVRMAAYVALTTVWNTQLLYVVQADTIPPDANSVFALKRSGRAWQSRGIVIRGGNRPTSEPVVHDTRLGPVLSWLETDAATGRIVARVARIGADGGIGAGPHTALSHDVFDLMSIALVGTTPRWIVANRHPARPDVPGVLTLIEWTGTDAVVRDMAVNPFGHAWISATRMGQSAVVGPLFDRTAPQENLVSGILRFAPRCSASVTRGTP